MTIEVALAISVVSFCFALFSGILNIRRNNKTDDQREQSDMTTVIVKLENISADTNEIKNDIKSVKADVRHNSEQIIRIDESLKSAWKIINEIQRRKGED